MDVETVKGPLVSRLFQVVKLVDHCGQYVLAGNAANDSVTFVPLGFQNSNKPSALIMLAV